MRLWLIMLGTLPLLAVGSGAIAGTAASPQNGLIATQRGDGIYLVDVQRGKTWRMPRSDDVAAPAWSPDGRLLAVEIWNDDGSSVYTVKLDGSDRRLVLKNAWSPSWSPDGKLVVVRDACKAPYHCNSDLGALGILVTVDADGGHQHQITFDRGNDKYGAGEPEWSPDGKWIAFVGGDGPVELMAPNGDGRRTLADSGSNLAWSPDGSRLAFDAVDAKQNFKQVIAVVDVATGRRTTLLSRTGTVSSAVWSPDGKQLAFLASGPHTFLGHCGEMTMDLWTMGVEGTALHRLSKAVYGQPSWGTFRLKPGD